MSAAVVAGLVAALFAPKVELLDRGGGDAARIALAATVRGKPVAEAYTAALTGLFAWLDRNGDGLLDDSERQILAARRGDADPTSLLSGLQGRARFPAEASLKPAEFVALYRDTEATPFAATYAALPDDAARFQLALFRKLDADGDGGLDAAERKNALAQLLPFDADGDERLTRAELAAGLAPAAAAPGPRPIPRGRAPAAALTTLVFDGPAGLFAARLQRAAGSGRGQKVTRAELGAGPETWAKVDSDRDQQATHAELAAWFAAAPAATVARERFGRGPAEVGAAPVVRVGLTEYQPAAAPDPSDDFAAQFGSITAAYAPPGKQADWNRLTLWSQFKNLAPFLDRDGDGRVAPAEAEAGAKVLAALAHCRAVVAVSDEGRDLLGRLDRSGDGALSLRELLGADDALNPGQGALRFDALPRRVRVAFQFSGLLNGDPNGRVVQDAAMRSDTPEPAAAGPAWFVKMDRNGDGDVSKREFLGPLAHFAKLDADGDGLISAAEAMAAKR